MRIIHVGNRILSVVALAISISLASCTAQWPCPLNPYPMTECIP